MVLLLPIMQGQGISIDGLVKAEAFVALPDSAHTPESYPRLRQEQFAMMFDHNPGARLCDAGAKQDLQQIAVGSPM